MREDKGRGFPPGRLVAMAKTTAPAEVAPPIGVSRSVAGSIRRRPFFQDSMIATALTGTSVMGVVNDLNVDLPEGAADVAARPLDEFGIALVLAQRRRLAGIDLFVLMTPRRCSCTRCWDTSRSFAAFGFLLALYTVAAYRERHTSVPVGIAAGSVVLLILGFGSEPVEPDAVVATLLLVASTWFIGDSVRIRRSEFVQLEDRATRLEREREAHAREAVAAERRVIARELHDVVAHDVSVIVTQAAAAQRIADQRPHEVIGALASIEHAGREALLEMRRLMGFLRPAGPFPGHWSRSRDSASCTVSSRRCARRVCPSSSDRRAGAADTGGLDLSAYRIVQEAVTNVMKHAGRARVTIEVRYLPHELQLQIDDEGLVLPPAGPSPRTPATAISGCASGWPSSAARWRSAPARRVARVAASLPIDTELR